MIRYDLLPGSPKADLIVRRIRDRLDFSYQNISQNFPYWDIAEEHYRAFRVWDDEDRESWRKHQVQKIVVPIQFATIQSMTTFMMEMFTALKPVLRVRGCDPRSVRPARVMELALDYDYRGNRGYFMLQQLFLNCFRYGYGVMENTWGRRTVLKNRVGFGPSSLVNIEGQDFEVQGALERTRDWFTLFEGNKWQIMDNRGWFPDPRVPLSRFQEGEFCGRRTFIHDNELRKGADDGLYFNVDRLEALGPLPSTRDALEPIDNSRRDRISGAAAFTSDLQIAKKNRMHVSEEIFIECSPRELELDDEDRPEHWMFTLIDGRTIIRAEPSPFYQFPYSVIECYPDILASMSQGLMDLTEPLAQHLSFLFNSHMSNVRKAVNDMFVVDPSKINLMDLLDPRAGKLIRLLPAAYGQDPAQFIKQLSVIDVTQNHVQDVKAILDLWNRIVGTSDTMHGQIAPSRRSASELQGVMKSSASRMKMLADLFSSEGIAPLTEQMAVTRQENMSEAQFFEIAGQTAAELGVQPSDIIDGFVLAQKDHLTGQFHFPAEEGVMPQERSQAGQLLQKVFETVAKAPFLTQVFDPVELFRETVRQFGMHNIDDFMRKGVRSDVKIWNQEQIQNAQARGNLQPLNVGRPDQGVRSDAEGLSLEGYVNGAGRTQDGTFTG